MRQLLLIAAILMGSTTLPAQKMQFQKYVFVRPHSNLTLIHKGIPPEFDSSDTKFSFGSAGASIGAGFEGIKLNRRFLIGLNAGWLINSFVFKGGHSIYSNYRFREQFTQHAPFVKFHLGIIVGKKTESFVNLQFGFGVMFPLNKHQGEQVIYDAYIDQGVQRNSPILYYQYKTKSAFEENFFTGLFSFGPYYQTKKLFDKSALRIGLELSIRTTATTREATIVEFRGAGDRTKIAETKYNLSRFNIGLNVGLTF